MPETINTREEVVYALETYMDVQGLAANVDVMLEAFKKGEEIFRHNWNSVGGYTESRWPSFYLPHLEVKVGSSPDYYRL